MNRQRVGAVGLLVALLVALLVLCPAGVPLRADDPPVQVQRDLVYGKGGDVELKLNLARPAQGAGPFPAVVCLHGGGWRSGKRQDLDGLMQLLARKNFVAVTVTYRLAPQHAFPAQIEDCKAAVRWLRANADKYHLDKEKIGAIGFSAGAHLACLLGAADRSAELEGKGGNAGQSSRVQAVVSFFGPTDFTTKTWNTPVEDYFLVPFLGGTYETKKDAYRRASPLPYVTKDDPPFLFFHGAKDTLVGIDNSEKMAKKLQEVGVRAKLVTLPDEGHGWAGPKLTRTLEQSIAFFEENLRK